MFHRIISLSSYPSPQFHSSHSRQIYPFRLFARKARHSLALARDKTPKENDPKLHPKDRSEIPLEKPQTQVDSPAAFRGVLRLAIKRLQHAAAAQNNDQNHPKVEERLPVPHLGHVGFQSMVRPPLARHRRENEGKA